MCPYGILATIVNEEFASKWLENPKDMLKVNTKLTLYKGLHIICHWRFDGWLLWQYPEPFISGRPVTATDEDNFFTIF